MKNAHFQQTRGLKSRGRLPWNQIHKILIDMNGMHSFRDEVQMEISAYKLICQEVLENISTTVSKIVLTSIQQDVVTGRLNLSSNQFPKNMCNSSRQYSSKEWAICYCTTIDQLQQQICGPTVHQVVPSFVVCLSYLC